MPTDERLKAPLIRSPSQWPGTSRAPISSGRLIILSDSGTMALPAKVVRLSPRAGLACRSASIIAAFSPPRGCAQIAAETRLVADAGRRVTLVHKPQSVRNLFG